MVQEEVKKATFEIARIVKVDPAICLAISEIESTHGLHLKSPTGALGIFQMTTIAMKDLHMSMVTPGLEINGILAGVGFWNVLKTRHKDDEKAVAKYCDPKDRDWYIKKTLDLASEYRKEIIEKFCL